MDTLQKRTGIMAHVVDTNKVLTNKRVQIEIIEALPFLIMEDDIITNNSVIGLSTTPVADLNTLHNILVEDTDTVVERYVYVTEVKSPITNNSMTIYYDKTFKDLIMIPSLVNIDTNDVVSGSVTFKLKGYAIGVNYTSNYENEITRYPYDDETSTQLPLSNENIGVDIDTVLINGVGGYVKEENVSKYFTDTITDIRSYLPLRSQYTNFVNLGSVINFLSSVTKIPTYLIYQASKDKHNVMRLGNTDTGTNNIYFELKF